MPKSETLTITLDIEIQSGEIMPANEITERWVYSIVVLPTHVRDHFRHYEDNYFADQKSALARIQSTL